MLRRATALLMLVVLAATNVEVGFGLARDGAVHHESETLAVVHAQARVGPVVGHGHEGLEAHHPQADDHQATSPRVPTSVDEASADRHDHAEGSEARPDGEDHDHGTNLDHCTHLHAPALPGHAPAPAPVRLLSVLPFMTAELPYEGSYDVLFHPPKA